MVCIGILVYIHVYMSTYSLSVVIGLLQELWPFEEQWVNESGSLGCGQYVLTSWRGPGSGKTLYILYRLLQLICYREQTVVSMLLYSVGMWCTYHYRKPGSRVSPSCLSSSHIQSLPAPVWWQFTQRHSVILGLRHLTFDELFRWCSMWCGLCSFTWQHAGVNLSRRQHRDLSAGSPGCGHQCG